MIALLPREHVIDVQSISTELRRRILLGAWGIVYPDDKRCAAYVPKGPVSGVQVNRFLEPSTRTDMSFRIAGRKLGLDVHSLYKSESSFAKGERADDEFYAFMSMGVNVFVSRSGGDLAYLVEAGVFPKPYELTIMNAGDGISHPVQAFKDALTLIEYLGTDVCAAQPLEGANIAICGDIKHSRVAASVTLLLEQLGGKWTGLEQILDQDEADPVEILENKDIKVMMMLRTQKERGSNFKFTRNISYEDMQNNSVAIMHPGPIAQDDGIDLLDIVSMREDPRYLVDRQIFWGVPVCMSCLWHTYGVYVA